MSKTVIGTAEKAADLKFYASFMINSSTLLVYVGSSDSALPAFRVSDAKLTYSLRYEDTP